MEIYINKPEAEFLHLLPDHNTIFQVEVPALTGSMQTHTQQM